MLLINVMAVIEKIRRVLLISSKPDKYEFKQSLKVTGMGIVIIGIVGFVIFLVVQLLTAGAGI